MRACSVVQYLYCNGIPVGLLLGGVKFVTTATVILIAYSPRSTATEYTLKRSISAASSNIQVLLGLKDISRHN